MFVYFLFFFSNVRRNALLPLGAMINIRRKGREKNFNEELKLRRGNLNKEKKKKKEKVPREFFHRIFFVEKNVDERNRILEENS